MSDSVSNMFPALSEFSSQKTDRQSGLILLCMPWGNIGPTSFQLGSVKEERIETKLKVKGGNKKKGSETESENQNRPISIRRQFPRKQTEKATQNLMKIIQITFLGS